MTRPVPRNISSEWCHLKPGWSVQTCFKTVFPSLPKSHATDIKMGKKVPLVEDGAGNMVPKGSKTDPEMVAQRAAAAERRAAKASAKASAKPATSADAGPLDYSSMGRIKLLKLAKERQLDYKLVQKDPDALRKLLQDADGVLTSDTGLKLLAKPITIGSSDGNGDGDGVAAAVGGGAGDDEGAATTVRECICNPLTHNRFFFPQDSTNAFLSSFLKDALEITYASSPLPF